MEDQLVIRKKVLAAVGISWLLALGIFSLYGFIPGFLATLAAVAGTLGAYNIADWRSKLSFTIPHTGAVGGVLAVALFTLSFVAAPNLTIQESDELQTALSNKNWSAVLVLLDDAESSGRTKEQEQLYQTAKAELAIQASTGGDWVAVVALLEDGERTEAQEQIYRTAKVTHDEAIQRLQSEENWYAIANLLDIKHAGIKRSSEQERVYQAANEAQAQAKKAAEEAEEEVREQRKKAAEESMKQAKEAQDRAKKAEEQAAKAEERKEGFHCLSAWDGNHREMEKLIKRNLNDPESMETVETRIGPVLNARHVIRVEFTAKNAFGGRIRNTARGYVDHASCKATLTSIN